MRNLSLIAAFIALALAAWLLVGREPPSAPVIDGNLARATAPAAELESAAVDGPATRTAGVPPLSPSTPAATAAARLDDAGSSLARVVGRLVDPDGAPVVGAPVTLRGRTASWAEPDVLATLDEHGWWHGVEAESDAGGAFEVTSPVPVGDVELRVEPASDHNHLRVAFRADDERPGPLREGITDLGTLMLVDTGSIAGAVVDEAGVPLGDAVATVRVEELSRSARVDANGRYLLRNVPPGTHEVRASCDGRMSGMHTDVEVLARRTTTGVDFVLGPSPTISGRVVDTHGRPQEVRVLATALSGGSNTSGATDAAGRFTLLLRTDDLHRLRVRRANFEPLAREPAARVAAAGEDDVELVIEHVLVTALLVLDDATGEPVGAFDVAVVRKVGLGDHEQPLSGTPRADGRLEIEVDPELHTLVVHADGYVAWGGPVVHEDEHGTQTVRLKRGGSIRGRVVAGGVPVRTPAIRIASTRILGGDGTTWVVEEVDEDGNPAVGAQDDADLAPALPQHQGKQRLVHGATDGTFRIDGLAPGRYWLRATGPAGTSLSVPRVDVVARAAVDLGDLALPAGGRIVGTLLVSAGVEVAGLGIGLDSPVDPTTHADANGRFTIDGVAAGAHELVVLRDRSRIGRPERVRVADGGTAEVVIDLSESIPCIVRVRVLVRGTPRAGMQLSAFDADGNQVDVGRSTTTDDDGRATLAVDPGRPVEIVVRAPSSLFVGHSEPVDCPSGGEASVVVDLDLGALTVALPPGLELPSTGRGVLQLDGGSDRPLARRQQESSGIVFDCSPTAYPPWLSNVVFQGRAWDLGEVPTGRTTVRVTLGDERRSPADPPETAWEGVVDVASGERATCALAPRGAR